MNDIVFNRGEGGLGRPLAGKDHYSGKLFYTAGSLPSGFGTSDRIKKIFSIDEAEALGILDDHADETKGTGGQVVIGSTWIIGEMSSILIDGAYLGTFTALDTTIVDQVDGLVTAINAQTNTGLKHGWVAANVTDSDIALTQPDKLGITNNTGSHITFETDSVAGTGTVTQFSSGVGSYFAVMHYHISEYFREQPKGVLWVGIYAQATFDGAEIPLIQNYSNGEIRELGIYLSHETFASSHLTICQGQLDTLEGQHKPMSIIFHADMSSATLADFTDLTTLTNQRVSAEIGEEGDYHQAAYDNTKAYLNGDKVTFQGKTYKSKANTTGNAPWDASVWIELRINLYQISGFSIGNMGTCLGAVAFARVHEDIAWIAKFNLVTETGLDEVAFATGDLWNNISTSLKDALNDYHYIFIRKVQGITGTYFNDSWTAISSTSDYATIENNRTMDKAIRNIRTNVLPNLAAPLYVNEDGTLSEDTIALFKNDAQRALIDMVTSGELSAQAVTIDPTQNVLSTSKIVIGVTLVPVGVAREIQFNIGFAVKIA